MAVFTKLLKEDIENFISDYAIGNLERFEEIKSFYLSRKLEVPPRVLEEYSDILE